MTNAFELAFAIITGLGGGGAIVFALSSWLGKVWANRILEKEKSEHAKEIEHYKSELKKELQRINAIQDKALYISKAQYDNEYGIYQEIWEKMFDCVIHTRHLYPSGLTDRPVDGEGLEKYNMDIYKRYTEAFNQFSLAAERNAPFYKKEFYDVFICARQKCNEIGNIFKMYEIDVKYSMSFAMARDTKMDTKTNEKVYGTFHTEIEELSAKLREDIRNYLLSLRLVE